MRFGQIMPRRGRETERPAKSIGISARSFTEKFAYSGVAIAASDSPPAAAMTVTRRIDRRG